MELTFWQYQSLATIVESYLREHGVYIQRHTDGTVTFDDEKGRDIPDGSMLGQAQRIWIAAQTEIEAGIHAGNSLGPPTSMFDSDETFDRVKKLRGFCLDEVSTDLDTVRAVLTIALAETEEMIRNRGNR